VAADTVIVEREPARATPTTIWLIGTLLCVAGLAVSSYLTYAHYYSPKVLVCPEKGLINCTKVTTSSYSTQFGIPLAVLGLAYFVVSLGFHNPFAWRSPSLLVRYGRVAVAAGGTGMALWLVSVELFQLDAICLYCTAVHILTLLVFILTAIGTALTAPLRYDDDVEDDDEEEEHDPVLDGAGS
jgi:uncharacterized membrane protein